jgi:hypothetical protein
VEIINNEVIAAGQNLANPQLAVLLHCRVTPQQLEFTIRTLTADQAQLVLQEIKKAFE